MLILSDDENLGVVLDHVVSLASGHQRSERRGGATSYFEDRNKKVAAQHEEHVSESKILNNVRVYINGYLSDTTDIEFKRIVSLAGGRIMWVYLLFL